MKKYIDILISLLLLVIFVFTINYASSKGGVWVVADCLLVILSIIYCIKANRSNGSKRIAGGLTVTIGIIIVVVAAWMFIILCLHPFGG